MPARHFDPTDPVFTRSFVELKPHYDLITSDHEMVIRHDPMAAAVSTLGALPRALSLKEQARAELGAEAAAHFDLLEPATFGLVCAHARHSITLHGADVEALAGTVSDKHDLLLTEARGLVHKKVMPGTLLAELRGGNAYRDLAFDVLQLVTAFRQEWPTALPYTTVTERELDEAEGLAHKLAAALGDEEQGAMSPTAEDRRRAYAFFIRTRDEVRRAISYLRWDEEDADSYLPSLFAGRGRKADEDEVDVTPAVAPTNGQPTPAPGMPGAPALGPVT